MTKCFKRDENVSGLPCVQSSVGYERVCTRCDSKHAYIGEASRTKEHLANYRAAAAANLPALTVGVSLWKFILAPG